MGGFFSSTIWSLCIFRTEENRQELQIEMAELLETRCEAWESYARRTARDS